MSVSIGGGGAAAAAVRSQVAHIAGSGGAAGFSPPPGYAAAVDAFRAAQRELQAAVEAEAGLRAQQNESELVRAELAALKPAGAGGGAGGETVYKLMGQVLVRQDAADARAVVDGRLDFLGKELFVLRVGGRPLCARRRTPPPPHAAAAAATPPCSHPSSPSLPPYRSARLEATIKTVQERMLVARRTVLDMQQAQQAAVARQGAQG